MFVARARGIDTTSPNPHLLTTNSCGWTWIGAHAGRSKLNAIELSAATSLFYEGILGAPRFFEL